MKSILNFYYMAYNAVVESGYIGEIDYIDALKPVEQQDAHSFFLEYVWCVLNAGMKEQIAKKIYERYCENFDINLIRHPTKQKAIQYMFSRYISVFETLQESDNKIEFLQTLKWIGTITKYHLARNIGIETVKPDRHLIRLAEMFNFDTPLLMCEEIKKDNGTKLGTIDVVLWRYCNLFPSYTTYS